MKGQNESEYFIRALVSLLRNKKDLTRQITARQ